MIFEQLENQLEEIKKWNEETFPDATLAGQLAKLEEEFIEFDEAINGGNVEEIQKEMADIFIVLGGLRRWESRIGGMITNSILEGMPATVFDGLLKGITKKMEINRKRTWKKSGDGKFQHSNKE